jgi:hypothetical protein
VARSKEDKIESAIDGLKQLDLTQLRARWRTEFGRKAPEHLPKSLLFRIIAYHLQVQAFGGLSRQTEQTLDAIARSLHRTGSMDEALRHQTEALRAGTVLVREHGGEIHNVTVGMNGTFIWQGKTYNSLTKVAKAITGTNWNGPRFFGLRDRKEGKAS